MLGQFTYHNTGFLDGVAQLVKSKTAKAPKKGSIQVTVTAVPDNPADGNIIAVAGTVECKKKPNESFKYLIGGSYPAVPSPFTVKAPFPKGLAKPAACRLTNVTGSWDPQPPRNPFFEPWPTGTFTIKVLWKH